MRSRITMAARNGSPKILIGKTGADGTRCNVGGCSDIVRREPSCAAGVCSRSRFLVAALLGMTNRGNDKSWGEALSARLLACGSRRSGFGSRLSGYRNMLPSFARPPGRGRPGLRGLAMDCMGSFASLRVALPETMVDPSALVIQAGRASV